MPAASDRLHRSLIRRLPIAAKRALLYAEAHRRRPHLGNPRTFTEKLNWRIVHDRRPLIGQLGDKLAMKDYAARACPGLSIPRVLWAGTDVGELAGAGLPERWVLKPNHGTLRVHRGAGRPDVAALRRLTADWLDEPLWPERGEWVYSQARRLILAEEFLGRPGEVLVDHKFLVFGGRARLVQVDTGRLTGSHSRRLYTRDWVPVEAHEPHVATGPDTAPPAALPEMIAVAETLGAAFDFVRVDLYDVAGTVWFSELTPYPGGGLDPFDPDLDRLLGGWWTLPGRAEVRAP
ncbi:ATP-grasp fold amidoligase family protein [Blastococcus sp. SYSU DS0539]